jgi:hypothetical protein
MRKRQPQDIQKTYKIPSRLKWWTWWGHAEMVDIVELCDELCEFVDEL